MATATVTYGTMREYDPDTESISAYLERLQLYFESNDIANAKKVSVLLTVIGPKVYGLLRGLMAPALPKEKSLKDLEKALKEHYEPQPLVIAERFHFYKRAQSTGESLADYLAELRRLARMCDFGAFLNEALRDRFVVGMKSESIQKRLLSEAKLTLPKALEIAQGMETAAQKAKEFKESPSNVMQIRTPRHPKQLKQQPTLVACYRCGRNNHRPPECRFRNAKCHKCGKTGHIAPVCRSAKKSPTPSQPNQPKTNVVEVASTGDLEQCPQEEELALFTVGTNTSQPIKLEVEVNSHPLVMELDTGADVSLISEKTYRSHFSKSTLLPLNVPLRTYTGEQMQVLGKLKARVKYEQQSPCELTLVVVAGDGPSLFGRNWLRRYQKWPIRANHTDRVCGLVCGVP